MKINGQLSPISKFQLFTFLLSYKLTFQPILALNVDISIFEVVAILDQYRDIVYHMKDD